MSFLPRTLAPLLAPLCCLCLGLLAPSAGSAQAPTANIIQFQNVSCNGGSDGSATASASGGTVPYSYAWSNSATTLAVQNLVAGTYTFTVTDSADLSDDVMVTITEPTAISVQVSGTTELACNGDCDGSIVLTVSGGTGAYTYEWDHGPTTKNLSNLCAGTYTVTVTDANGCEVEREVVLSEPAALPAPLASATPNPATEGATVQFSASGAGATGYAWTGPNSFAADSAGPSLANVTAAEAGTYSATYTVGACTSPATDVELVVDPVPDASIPEPDASLPDASLDDGSVMPMGDDAGDDAGDEPASDAALPGDGGGTGGGRRGGGGGCAVENQSGSRSSDFTAPFLLLALGLLARRSRSRSRA